MVRKRARAFVVGLVGVLAWAVYAPVGGAATAVSPAAPGGVAATVTLVTGDVVTLGGPRGVAVRAGEGRGHIGFRSYTDSGGDVHVLPEDVLGLVSSGWLDSRLFDVTVGARRVRRRPTCRPAVDRGPPGRGHQHGRGAGGS